MPKGYLPVFTVGSEKEAEQLLVGACPTNMDGDFVAPELVEEQTLENLYTFGERLERVHARLVKAGLCDCKGR